MDGRVVTLADDWAAEHAYKAIGVAPAGDVLAAISFDGNVLVRWIDLQASLNVVPAQRAMDYKLRSQGVKPTKKLCPWFHAAVEMEFEHVAAEHNLTIQTLHESTRNEMIAHGKQPESYRRWLSKLKKRWVRAVVSNGKRVDDLGTLSSVT